MAGGGGGAGAGAGAGGGAAAGAAGAAATGISIRSRDEHFGHRAVRPSAPGRARSFVPHDPQVTTTNPSGGEISALAIRNCYRPIRGAG
jgi:hypothetical protein